MPLTCLGESGERIQAFDLTDQEWSALKVRNRRDQHLRMACCSSSAVLKQSSRGTCFFSHKRVGPCTTADESEEHRQLKLLAIDAARGNGWSVEAEVSGATPSGEQWRADVLATKGSAKVAVEIQWSGQVDAETMRRQRRYQEAGIRCLWLLRQPGFEISNDLPATCIGGSIADGFVALLPHHWMVMRRKDRAHPDRWRQSAPMRDFLDAAFSRRLKWGDPTTVFGEQAEVEVRAAEALCWHEWCGVFTEIVTRIIIRHPGMEFDASPADFDSYPGLWKQIVEQFPESFDASHLKRRYSRTQQRSYLSNGCLGCDRIYGDYHLGDHWDADFELVRLSLELEDQWMGLARSLADYEEPEEEWWVVPVRV